MQLIARADSWLQTAAGDPRGYIETSALRELWFHTGTACNLKCPFCLEGSKPGDDRLQLMTLADVRPFIDEAVELGVENFSFTGGEPFVAREFHRILAYALHFKPCLVLTNGTRPLLQRLHQLDELRYTQNALRFRISIDYPERSHHEIGRGEGTFDESFKALQELHLRGFEVSVARQWSADEDSVGVERAYQDLFEYYDLPHTIRLISFPDFLTPGSTAAVPEISENCMKENHSCETRAQFMCGFSRMVVKQNGSLGVYACTLVDDDPDYNLGGTLRESLKPRVMLRHHRCFSCFKHGASCSEI
jgi:sulfatase maturation enzyme AslB (radical SAM superfamily)